MQGLLPLSQLQGLSISHPANARPRLLASVPTILHLSSSVLFPLPDMTFPISGTLSHPSGFGSIITSSVKSSQTPIPQTESGIIKSVHSDRCPLGLCHSV